MAHLIQVSVLPPRVKFALDGEEICGQSKPGGRKSDVNEFAGRLLMVVDGLKVADHGSPSDQFSFELISLRHRLLCANHGNLHSAVTGAVM
jgi:hypothetical protein